MKPNQEDVTVFLGPGVISKPSALAANIEKLMSETNAAGRAGKILIKVKTKSEFGQGTFAVLTYELPSKSIIKG